jgi:hypothetical protein
MGDGWKKEVKKVNIVDILLYKNGYKIFKPVKINMRTRPR